jgi:hypothetical protein
MIHNYNIIIVLVSNTRIQPHTLLEMLSQENTHIYGTRDFFIDFRTRQATVFRAKLI